jgi:hypothetical protein
MGLTAFNWDDFATDQVEQLGGLGPRADRLVHDAKYFVGLIQTKYRNILNYAFSKIDESDI